MVDRIGRLARRNADGLSSAPYRKYPPDSRPPPLGAVLFPSSQHRPQLVPPGPREVVLLSSLANDLD